ncbi:hypothetical protein VE04_06559 [Pseudogymnoascus sp. 24MN13]|nr:hypothetical protein VE04_06559 [Pseudogymnoascus sp. 24MN13]
MAQVSVGMYLSMIVFKLGHDNGLRKQLVGWWFIMIFITSWLAGNILKASAPPQGRNTEVACFLPDKCLLTSVTQLSERLNLECTYSCFLKGGSILKPQSAATVVRNGPSNDRVSTVGGHLSINFCSAMLLLGIALQTLHSRKMFPNRLQQVITRHPAGPESEARLHAIMTPIFGICLMCVATWLIMMEYSIRNIPIEENFSAIGQWAPWATGVFGTIGTFLYQHGGAAYEKKNKEGLQAVINEAMADSSDDDNASFVTAEEGDNISEDISLELGRGLGGFGAQGE